MIKNFEDIRLLSLLKDRVNNYFSENNKSKKGDIITFLKILIYSCWIAGSYAGLLMFGKISVFHALLFYMLFGLGSAFFVVSVAHDASHQALSKNAFINKFFSYSWNLVGISKYLWEIKHHGSHHVYTNIPHKDVDIAENPLIRYNSAYRYKPQFRYQHIYAVFLYGIFGIFAVYVRDFLLFKHTKFSGNNREKHPANAFYLLIFTKIAYAIFSYVIPMIFLPFEWWQTLLIYFSALAISGAAIILMLVIPHINSDAQNTILEQPNLKGNEWVKHQAKSTADYSINSFWINWFTGGLNTHLTHHLFPNICHTHYRRLTPIIKNTLEEYGISYKNKSLSGAIVDHFRFLESVGKNKQPAFEKLT